MCQLMVHLFSVQFPLRDEAVADSCCNILGRQSPSMQFPVPERSPSFSVLHHSCAHFAPFHKLASYRQGYTLRPADCADEEDPCS
ncbi:unnamed protein product [Chondrus crispus]|uniref:Uncharacterized protein n=1 Tax=Chondrus crispus TaxID=2769 RepID=R7Q2N4_CHOCR|nr:unnamed protein product [Chondrus crispus]CDF32304.1 unnamed protein product [Chondrus crispus]|eukprot:XP_005711969.1 unnamed protein product [Chondrus crispus]